MQNSVYVKKQDISKVFIKNSRKYLLSRLDFELTERCNNNCIHCCINLPLDDINAINKELSTSRIEDILKQAVALGCMSVRFTGGEPFLRKDFEELYVFARRIGLKVCIFTNATLISEHLAELFATIPSLEKIEVSVYGMHKASYENISRVPGSFNKAWQGINLLLEKKIPFVVKSAFLPDNKEEVVDFEQWASTIPGMDKPPSYALFFDLHSRRDEKRNELIRSLRISPEEGLKFLTRRKDEYLKGMREFCAKFMRPSADKLFSCGSGVGGGCVDAYGYFQPCLMLRDPHLAYNLKTGSLKDALINFFPKLRETKAVNPEYLARCAKCFLKGLCEQCPAKSWAEYGTLDAPVEYLCQVAHAQARFLGLLKEEENAWEVKDWQDRINSFIETKEAQL